MTANPSKEIADSFGENLCHTLRDPLINRSVIKQSVKKITPFTNIDKKRIVTIYKEFGIMDSLFPLTRSCEISGKLDYLAHCENCWWCKERQWSLNII